MLASGQAPAYIIGETVENSEWHNITTPYNCIEWTPLTNTINSGVKFTQSQACDVTRERDIYVFNLWSDGRKTPKYQYKDTQSDGVVTERQAVGTKPYITGQYVTHSAWSNSGAPYSCGAWSPHVSTVNKGTRFTQKSSCQQKQAQAKKTFNRWTDGRTDLVKTETLYKVVGTSKSQTATGTKVVITEVCRGFQQGSSHAGIINGIQMNQSGTWLYWDGFIQKNNNTYDNWTRLGSYEYKRGSRSGGGGMQTSWGVCRRNIP